MNDTLTIFAPNDSWLVKLAQGWRFCEASGPFIISNLYQPHGNYSVLLWRPA